MRQVVYNYGAGSATNIITTSQAGTSGAALVLNTATTFDNTTLGQKGLRADSGSTARSIALASTANLSSVLFTVTGIGLWGETQTFTITGPNNSTVYSTTGAISVISSIIPNATFIAASGVTAGFGTSGRTSWMIPSTYVPSYNMAIGATVTGTLAYTVFETIDNLFTVTSNAQTFSSPTAALVAASGSQYKNETNPVGGYYVGVTGTGTGSLSATFLQIWQ